MDLRLNIYRKYLYKEISKALGKKIRDHKLFEQFSQLDNKLYCVSREI